MLNDVGFNELYAFVVTAEKLHFGEAAEHLNMTQPNLSRIIKALEAKLGYKVFLRSTRRVEVTREGAVLLPEAALIVDQMKRIRVVGQHSRPRDRRKIVVSCTPSLSVTIARVLSEFQVLYPAIGIELRLTPTLSQIGLLLEGDVLIAFLRPLSGAGGLHMIMAEQLPVAARAPMLKAGAFSTLLFREEHLCVALPTSHALTGKEYVEISDLTSEKVVRFVSPPLDPVYNEQIDRIFLEAGIARRDGPEATDTMSALALVAASLAVAFVPQTVAELQCVHLPRKLQPFR